MNSNTKFFDIINAVDEGIHRNEVVEELSNPSFLIGSKVTVNRLLNKMIQDGFIEEKSDILIVTSKGRDFYNCTEILDL